MGILRKRNSANFGDMFLVMVIIFAVALFIVILSFAFSQIEPKLNEGLTSSIPAEAGSNVTKILDKTATSLTRINTLFPFLIAGLFGFVLISALFLRSHPAFFFIALMILASALIIGAVFSNVFQDVMETDTFADTAEDFGIMELFLKNLPLIILLFFVASALILWARPRATGGAY